MCRFHRSIISPTIVLIFVFSTFTTYVIQHVLGFGEYIAEGVPAILGMAILGYFYLNILEKGAKIDKVTFHLFFSYVLYLLILTCFIIVSKDENPLKLIFFYQYVPFLMISFAWCDIQRIRLDPQVIFLAISVAGSVSAIFGMLQFFQAIEFIPIDINRSRGLSRSTLNYSSLLFLAYIACTNLDNLKLRQILSAFILCGVLSSQSRGAILGVLLYTIIRFYRNKVFYKGFITYFIFCAVIIFVLDWKYKIYEYLAQHLGFSELIYRLGNSANITSSDNSLRVQRYLEFFKQFSVFGNGIGSTGPAANRFQEGVHFESYVLNLLSQGGLLSILFWPIFLVVIKIRVNYLTSHVIALAVSFFSMMALQQTFETPSVYLMAWLVLVCLIIDSGNKILKNQEKFVDETNC